MKLTALIKQLSLLADEQGGETEALVDCFRNYEITGAKFETHLSGAAPIWQLSPAN